MGAVDGAFVGDVEGDVDGSVDEGGMSPGVAAVALGSLGVAGGPLPLEVIDDGAELAGAPPTSVREGSS